MDSDKDYAFCYGGKRDQVEESIIFNNSKKVIRTPVHQQQKHDNKLPVYNDDANFNSTKELTNEVKEIKTNTGNIEKS